MKQPIIEFTNFTFQYQSQQEPTLHDINLTINEHEKILICGLSGSGKSTLGHCLNGLIPFSYPGQMKGEIKIKGQIVNEQSIFDRSKDLGTILQDPDGQFVSLTVGEDIAFVLENYNVNQPKMKTIVHDMATLVEMEDFLETSPAELSGGQKQRVALAGVLANNVDILLFDEPLANLDPQAGEIAINLIDQLFENQNKTVIIIEHRLEDVLYRKVDRILLIDEGRIVANMSPNELLSSLDLVARGIREPLYVSLLRYANIKLTTDLKLESIETLAIEQVKDAVLSWYQKQPKPKVEEERKPLLELKDVSFSYDGKRLALSDVNMTIYEGEMLSIVGKNGAGKSTLSKVITGYETMDSGQLFINGIDHTKVSLKKRAEHIGLVLQNPNQMISQTLIFDEIASGLKYRGETDEEVIKDKVEEVMKVCGLWEFRDWPISALSFGQKKRVTIASILVLDPELLILDEPTAAQDLKHYTDIMSFLVQLNERGQTIVLITHDMHLILEYADRCVVLSEGTIIMEDKPSVVLGHEDVVDRASLKQTSLYKLAEKVGIDDQQGFVQAFIDHEKRLRHEK